jgi:hypothetical protein
MRTKSDIVMIYSGILMYEDNVTIWQSSDTKDYLTPDIVRRGCLLSMYYVSRQGGSDQVRIGRTSGAVPLRDERASWERTSEDKHRSSASWAGGDDKVSARALAEEG